MNSKWMVISLLLLASQQSWSAACCGGGASFPSLISGDFKSQLSMSSTFGRVVGDVSPDGESIFRRDQNRETTQTLKLDYAYQARDLWQVALAAPLVQKDRSIGDQSRTTSGLGDLSLNVAYEFMPEYSYTVWKPRGFLYIRNTFPTAPSIYDFKEPLATDARGSGFVSQAVGAFFMKSRGTWDFQGALEIAKGWTREFESHGQRTTVTPGTSFGLLASAGYSPPKISEWRFGAGLSPRYTSPKQISSNGVSSTSSEEWAWDTTFSISYLIEKEWMTGLTYLDQTLMGPAQNTTLTRSVSFLLQKRWSL